MTPAAKLKNDVLAAAHEAGFLATAIASAAPLPELSRLNGWLSKKFNATMSWMERNPAGRCDPASLLHGARSVVCLAMKYRFERGRDYHDTVGKKLKRVCEAIRKHAPSARMKTCVDTSPILEKALAVRAGIGWQGKHSIVIHPDKGSFFVLGEIITDIQIEPDGPVSNGCGDCRKCIDACPTGAIVEPFVVDAGRCLSYLTIEHKGPAPHELTKHIKPEQYGCELCQKACPYNKGE